MTKRRNGDGTEARYYQLAENIWDGAKGCAVAKVIYNFGRADQLDADGLRRLARSILRVVPDTEAEATRAGRPAGVAPSAGEDLRLRDSWPYGGVYVVEACGGSCGIDKVLSERAQGAGSKLPVERALFAMVANRALAPCSKLYCWEQWLREDVFLPGAGGLALQHLYRAMDFLEENKAEVEKSVYFAMADLMNADGDVVFYDTTSLHFEVDEEDEHPQQRSDRQLPPCASGVTRRTAAATRRRSSSVWPSPVTGSRCARGSQAARCPRLCDAGAGNENRGGRLPLSVPRTVPRGTWAPSSPARRRTMSRSRRAESLSRLTKSRSRPAEGLSRLTERLPRRTDSRSQSARSSPRRTDSRSRHSESLSRHTESVSPNINRGAASLPRLNDFHEMRPTNTESLSRPTESLPRHAERLPRSAESLAKFDLSLPRYGERRSRHFESGRSALRQTPSECRQRSRHSDRRPRHSERRSCRAESRPRRADRPPRHSERRSCRTERPLS